MKSYLNILQKIVDEGVWKQNRTGIKTKSITGYMFEHNMKDGFPALTTKKLAFKTMAVELEGFIKGITSKKWYQERGCRIWDSWANPMKVPYGNDEETKLKMASEPDLGPIYGFGWRNFGGWYKPHPNIKTPFNKEKIEIDYSQNRMRIVGREYETNNYGNFIVTREYYDDVNLRYDVKFLTTGYVAEGITKQNIVETRQIRDPYYPSVYGVAATGFFDNKDEISKKLKIIWEGMISRCYNENDRCFYLYGDKGVYVDDRWLLLENFIYDAKSLPGYDKKLLDWEEYTLDKDFSQKGFYSKDTCVWLSKKQQVEFSSRFDKDFNSHLYNQGIDQFKNMIEKLKTNPLDRRNIVMAWNPTELYRMALPPCHYSFQVLSDGTNVDLLWNQRSCDVPIGIPFNIASYALLLELIGKETGLVPNKLIGFLADVHIYENQYDTVLEQLKREPLPLPKLEIENFTSIFDWTHDQAKLIDYNHHPKLEYPVAV